jgi:D-arabinose 1-dehydrogenase-like Zn-dependent alcohol dehydrogenase
VGDGKGQVIILIGIGGLGHMAVQFAKKLGNRVTVFTTSQDQAKFAHKMGADKAIVVGKGEIPQAPSSKLDILLSTVPAALDWVPYIDFLDSDCALAFVGVPDAHLSIPLFLLLAKRRRIMASPIGDRAMINQMLSIAEKFGIEPIIEVCAIAQANQAMQKVRDNQVRYRAALTIS